MSSRSPAAAGKFYPASPSNLRETVSRCLGDATVSPQPDSVCAVIAPHAGYPYSGPTAGYAFRRVLGKASRRVLLLGPSHHFQFSGLSVFTGDAFDTPLGPVPVDRSFCEAIVERFGSTCPEAHGPEHALEVELPFLQATLLPGFKIVPVLFGGYSDPTDFQLAEFLSERMEPDDLLLASTDLSHFLNEVEANALDRFSLDTILAGDPATLVSRLREGSCSLCGGAAVVVALAIANLRDARERHEWDYRTSAWATGDPSHVVGYGALTFERAG